MTTHYNLKNTRALLSKVFTNEDLCCLCYDIANFRVVYNQLTQNSGKAEIIHRLLSLADRTSQIDNLLALAKERNPVEYEKYQPYYDAVIASTVSPNGHEESQRTQASPFGAAKEIIVEAILAIIRMISVYTKSIIDFKQTINDTEESFTDTLSDYRQFNGTQLHIISSREKRKGIFKEARRQISLLKNFLHAEVETKFIFGSQQSTTRIISKGDMDSVYLQGPSGSYISATTHSKADVEPSSPRLPDIKLPSPRPVEVSPPPTIRPRNTPAEPPPYFTRHKATWLGSESIVSKTKNVNSWVTLIFVVATIYAFLQFGLANAIVSIVISLIVYTLVTTGIDSGFSSLKSKMGKLGHVLDYLAIICGVCAGLFIFSQMLTTKTGQSIIKWMAGESIQLLNWLLESF